MYSQVLIGTIIEATLLTVVIAEWVQLAVVEPGGGKIKLKTRPYDHEDDFQIQSPENSRTVDIEFKPSDFTTNSIPQKNIHQATNEFAINKILGQNTENGRLGNYKLDLTESDFPSASSVSTMTSSEENSSSQESTESIVQQTQWPYQSILETEPSVNIPDFHLHLTTNLKSPETQTESSGNGFSTPLWKTGGTITNKEFPYHPIELNTESGYKPKSSWISNSSSHDSMFGEGSTTQQPLDMIKAVHRTLIQETPHTVKGKMQFLQDLKIKMLTYMEKRIRSLWGPQDRQARTDKGMSFPSMEGALMSISFLIFAVFLIKLVQQLIQTLQGNNMAMMTAKRHTRSIPDLLTTARVLRLIDEFPDQYQQKLFNIFYLTVHYLKEEGFILNCKHIFFIGVIVPSSKRRFKLGYKTELKRPILQNNHFDSMKTTPSSCFIV